MQESNLMSLIQTHLNACERLHAHNHTTITALYYAFLTQQADPPNLLINRAPGTIGKDSRIGSPETQLPCFIGQPIYFIMSHLRFQQVWSER